MFCRISGKFCVKNVFSLSMTFGMEVRLGPLEQANLTETFHIHLVRGNDLGYHKKDLMNLYAGTFRIKPKVVSR